MSDFLAVSHLVRRGLEYLDTPWDMTLVLDFGPGGDQEAAHT